MKLFTHKILPFITALFVLGTLTPALAITEASKPSTNIDKSVLELGTAKDDDELSPEERLGKQIDARIKIITEVISLSIKEIGGLRDKLNQLPKFAHKSKEKEMQEDFLANLDAHEDYFNNQSKKLDDLKDEADQNKLNDGLRDLAKELKDYRDNTYNPAIQKIVDFVLLWADENAVHTAKTRLNKVISDIKKLEKFGLIDKGTFRVQLDKASRLIASASDLQAQAKGLILNPPDETVEEGDKEAAKEKLAKPKPRELIEKSFNQIKSAYDIFLKISKEVRKTLGID